MVLFCFTINSYVRVHLQGLYRLCVLKSISNQTKAPIDIDGRLYFITVVKFFDQFSTWPNRKVLRMASSSNISFRFSVAGANTKPSNTNFLSFSLSFKM